MCMCVCARVCVKAKTGFPDIGSCCNSIYIFNTQGTLFRRTTRRHPVVLFFLFSLFVAGSVVAGSALAMTVIEFFICCWV